MNSGRRGLYETVLTSALEASLADLEPGLDAQLEALRHAEAPDRIALHLGRLVQRALAGVPDRERVEVGVSLAQRVVALIEAEIARADVGADAPLAPGRLLRAITSRQPDGTSERIDTPLIPLLDTALLTNSPGEPRVGSQLLAEIASADRIDVVMAFIRRTGIQPMLDALRRHVERGRALRVLTTTYTGSTEAAALDDLAAAGAEILVSYDTGSTRLHAKSWLFHRDSGFSTAYIGSSNLTFSAQVTGLEWNVRVAGARNPSVIEKVAAVFESYWCGGDFVPYARDEFLARTDARTDAGPQIILSPVELRPEPFQERLLEQLTLARQQGHHRNLLVAATGTGKTVMAAVDYARLRPTLPRARLLFVAHRAEILTQSLATFRHALRDGAFGELWIGDRRPTRFEHVFASIQSLHATGPADLDPRHFDVVIVDEFHHAAAPTYQALLDHVQPTELLGLTATPERSDGLPLLDRFDGRIAAELRLWDAIDQQRLTPFAYFGVHDALDLREVPWRRGRGYDPVGLTNLITSTDVWARRVLKELERRVPAAQAMKALGFCVSVDHARYMARVFRDAGIPATAVWGDSPADERRRALDDLAPGRINALFSVDLFNEGVDVPAVDTLLLLRPTDSGTLFLQQLGRGLRRSHGKAVCTVLDFVGHHRREFRFDRRFRALLGGTRKQLVEQIERGFPFLPAGCHLELDAVASEIVLRNIREAVPSRWSTRVDELRQLSGENESPTLARYLDETGVELEDVYAGGRSWSELREGAGLPVPAAGAFEAELRRACGRLLHVDDPLRLATYCRFLDSAAPPDGAALPAPERRLLRMLVASLGDKVIDKAATLEQAAALLWDHPAVLADLRELFAVLSTRVDHVQAPLAERPDVPLRVHARYTRIEILAAFGLGAAAKVAAWQTGVYWAEQARADLLAFTLDKTSGAFSPTTRYRDYALSPELIHWESQAVVREASATGRRYQRHAAEGSAVMLFARLRDDDRAFWFLGPATYVRHEGELPMAITWRLTHPLPGDLFAAFKAAV